MSGVLRPVGCVTPVQAGQATAAGGAGGDLEQAGPFLLAVPALRQVQR